MLVEAQEGAHVSRVLAKEGDTAHVGKPIAIAYEDKARAESARKEELPKDMLPDVYAAGNKKVRVMMWQAYLKDAKTKGGVKTCM
jgi:pyruvate/2-oxoglutarate dehydrogenase complex dihydrolipoamide acyltransferase (E2) component